MCADRLGDRPDDPVDERRSQSRLYRLGRRLAGPADRCPADRRAARRTAITWSSCPIRVIKERTGRCYRLVIGAVPMAEEVYPWAAAPVRRSAWNFEAEPWPGSRSPRPTMNPPFRYRPGRARESRARCSASSASAAGGRALDVESLAPLVVSTYPEIREPADPAAPPSRAVAPVVLNGRIDPAGDDDQFVLAVTPGQRLRIKVRRLRGWLGARCRFARGRQRWLRARECRRHDDSAAAEERPAPVIGHSRPVARIHRCPAEQMRSPS